MAEKDSRKGKSSSSSKQTRAVIDRIEDEGMAVLLAGDDEKIRLDVPVSLLPEGARDGDHLRVTIALDKQARDEAEKSIRRIQEELKAESHTEGKKDFKL